MRPKALIDPLVQRLAYFTGFNHQEIADLDALSSDQLSFSDADILTKAGRQSESRSMLLLDGWAIRYRVLSDGRRQILRFVLPGEFLDPTTFTVETTDCSVRAIADGRMAIVTVDSIYRLFGSSTRIAAAFWWLASHDMVMARSHLVAVGRQTAQERIAYLLWELWARLRVIGQAGRDSFEFPGTQTMISDALGLSAVHTSRTLGKLKKGGFVRTLGQRIYVLDVAGLKGIAEVGEKCLHFGSAPEGMRTALGV